MFIFGGSKLGATFDALSALLSVRGSGCSEVACLKQVGTEHASEAIPQIGALQSRQPRLLAKTRDRL